jgi:hypothetical protein
MLIAKSELLGPDGGFTEIEMNVYRRARCPKIQGPQQDIGRQSHAEQRVCAMTSLKLLCSRDVRTIPQYLVELSDQSAMRHGPRRRIRLKHDPPKPRYDYGNGRRNDLGRTVASGTFASGRPASSVMTKISGTSGSLDRVS